MISKTLLRLFALTAVVMMLGAGIAEARRGGSFGSRGSRTYSAPPPTATAPGAAQPIQRTITPAPGPSMQQPGMAARPGMNAPARQGSRWGGLGMGLAAGFLGAGLFGLLTGQGFLGGLGSLMGLIGLLAQFALIAGIVYLVVRLVRGRGQAAAGPRPAVAGPVMTGAGMARIGSGPTEARPVPGTGGAGGLAAPRPGPSDAIGIGAQDYDAFERLLGAINEAYSREDVNALRTMATPEVVSYFAEDFRDNAARGVVTRVSDVKLLQGDLAEAWREQDADYATVAMRFSLTEVTLDRASGRIVDGNPKGGEVTEIWTFRRPHGGTWQLSAVQQPDA